MGKGGEKRGGETHDHAIKIESKKSWPWDTTHPDYDSTWHPYDTTYYPDDHTTWYPYDTTTDYPDYDTTWYPYDTTTYPDDHTTWYPYHTTTGYPDDDTTWIPHTTGGPLPPECDGEMGWLDAGHEGCFYFQVDPLEVHT